MSTAPRHPADIAAEMAARERAEGKHAEALEELAAILRKEWSGFQPGVAYEPVASAPDKQSFQRPIHFHPVHNESVTRCCGRPLSDFTEDDLFSVDEAHATCGKVDSALRKDAARYRWLRDGHLYSEAVASCLDPSTLDFTTVEENGRELDEAIDKEMANGSRMFLDAQAAFRKDPDQTTAENYRDAAREYLCGTGPDLIEKEIDQKLRESGRLFD